MIAGSNSSSITRALPVWRDPAAWARTADVLAVLVALSLPWSTSLVSIFVVIWLVTIAPTLDINSFLESLKRPVCALPIAFFILAVLGTLWSDVPWGTRLYAIGPVAKLLVLPVLIYHYERSSRGIWVFVAFFVSCTLLMMMSWLVAFDPRLAIKSGASYGIPVKNYIDQSQKFALCAVALAWPILSCIRSRRYGAAALFLAIAAAFIANMMFVTISRTAIVCMPIMLFVFALVHLKWRRALVTIVTAAALTGALWFVAPSLRMRTMAGFTEFHEYQDKNASTSVGQRLEFWRKSLHFFVEAPIVGHGTGTIRELFEEAALGQTGASAEVIGNPHNQTLNVAIQWGALGVAVLYAMWLFHLTLFRGSDFGAWIGLLVVVQNVTSSLFNSHLFDFDEGWMYVLGVGIAGGMMLGTRALAEKPTGAAGSGALAC